MLYFNIKNTIKNFNLQPIREIQAGAGYEYVARKYNVTPTLVKTWYRNYVNNNGVPRLITFVDIGKKVGIDPTTFSKLDERDYINRKLVNKLANVFGSLDAVLCFTPDNVMYSSQAARIKELEEENAQLRAKTSKFNKLRELLTD